MKSIFLSLIALFFSIFGISAVHGTKTILWDLSQVNGSSVQINIIDLSSTSPDTYRLVRTIATSTANTGTFNYVPYPTDTGYIEVGCVDGIVECHAYKIMNI